MAINFPGPYEVEYAYTVPVGGVTLAHVLRANCTAVGTPVIGSDPADVDLMTISGTPADLQTCADDFWDFLRPLIHSTVSCTGFTLWKYITGTFERTFVTSGSVANPAGFAAVAPVAASMAKHTYRTAAGGIMGHVLLESSVDSDAQFDYAALDVGNPNKDIMDYVVSGSGWLLARDDSFPIVPLRVSFGENEATWKTRFR